MASDIDRSALARDHARAWMEAYGIRTDAYTRSGGDHPMMATLPDAMLAFADALRSGAGEAMRPDAEAFARRAHAGQTDKAGLPYAGHLGRVAARAVAHAEARGWPAEEVAAVRQAAWLHDTIEDTGTTHETLATAGFDGMVIGAVLRLTRRTGVAYQDYIRSIAESGNYLAILVKLADLEDNTDPARPSAASLWPKLLERYEAAKAVLRAALPLNPEPSGATHAP